MKQVCKNLLQVLLLMGLITFAFWFALKDDMDAVIQTVCQISISFLILLLVIGVIYYVLQGYMLSYIAKKYAPHLTLKDGLENAYIAAFFNGVTPLGGGQVAQTYAFRKRGVPYGSIASILWKDFFLYQIIVVSFSFILFITHITFAFDHFKLLTWLIIIGWMINASVIFLLLTVSLFPKLYQKVSSALISFLHRIHIVKNKIFTLTKWNNQLQYFTKEVRQLKEDRTLIYRGLLINFIRMIIYYSIPFIVAIGLHLSLTFQDFLLIVTLSSFIHMLNALTPLPGDTGWTESAFIVIFCILFDRVHASGIMILWRLATYYIHILIGGFIFFRMKTRKN